LASIEAIFSGGDGCKEKKCGRKIWQRVKNAKIGREVFSVLRVAVSGFAKVVDFGAQNCQPALSLNRSTTLQIRHINPPDAKPVLCTVLLFFNCVNQFKNQFSQCWNVALNSSFHISLVNIFVVGRVKI
jgi:hypothetical protein